MIRKKILKVYLFFGLIFIYEPLHSMVHENFQKFLRAGEFDQTKSHQFHSVKPISCSLYNFNTFNYVEGYVYKDLSFPNGEIPFIDPKNLCFILNTFDKEIYPRYNQHVTVDPKATTRSRDKIIILFDNIHDEFYYQNKTTKEFSARFSRYLTKYYHQDIFVIDINYINPWQTTYILTHELQHLIRYHYHENESLWLDEGLAQFIDYYLNGFPIESLLELEHQFKKDCALDSCSRQMRSGYSDNFLFIYYLYKHYGGIDFIRTLITNNEQRGVENIQQAMNVMKNKLEEKIKLDSSSELACKLPFFSFKKALINYHIALLSNNFRNKIKSCGNFYDLELDQEQLLANSTLKYFSIDPENLLESLQVTVGALNARYFQLRNRCIKIEIPPLMTKAPSTSSVLGIIFDWHSNDDNKVIRPVKTEGCLENVKNNSQYLILINTSAQNEDLILKPY